MMKIVVNVEFLGHYRSFDVSTIGELRREAGKYWQLAFDSCFIEGFFGKDDFIVKEGFSGAKLVTFYGETVTFGRYSEKFASKTAIQLLHDACKFWSLPVDTFELKRESGQFFLQHRSSTLIDLKKRCAILVRNAMLSSMYVVCGMLGLTEVTDSHKEACIRIGACKDVELLKDIIKMLE